MTLLSFSRVQADADLAEVQRSVLVRQGVTCLAPQALHEQTLGWLRAAKIDGHVRVEVLGSEDDPRSATMRVHNGRGELSERSFAPGPERCNDFLSAVALAAALALKAPAELPRNVRAQLPTPVLPAVPGARDKRPVHPLTLDAAAFMMWPDRPPLAGGGELLLRYGSASRAQLRAGLLGARRGRASTDTGFHYALRTLAARIEVCTPYRPNHALELALCGALLAGRLTALVQELGQRRGARMRLLDAGPSLLLRYRLDQRLELLVGAALWLGLEPRRLSSREALDEAAQLTPLPRLSALFSLGCSFDLRAYDAAAKDLARSGINER